MEPPAARRPTSQVAGGRREGPGRTTSAPTTQGEATNARRKHPATQKEEQSTHKRVRRHSVRSLDSGAAAAAEPGLEYHCLVNQQGDQRAVHACPEQN